MKQTLGYDIYDRYKKVDYIGMWAYMTPTIRDICFEKYPPECYDYVERIVIV